MKNIVIKFKQSLKEKGINYISIFVFTTFSFIVGNVAQLYSTYTGLPIRVKAVETSVEELKIIKVDIVTIREAVDRHDEDDKKIITKLDKLETKIDTLTLKLVK